MLMDLFLPHIAYAQATDFEKHLANINTQIINPLILFLFALALAYFAYGVFEFIANFDNDEKKTAGKSHMLWGIIGIAVMMGVWTILGAILSTFNIEGIDPKNGTVELPNTPL